MAAISINIDYFVLLWSLRPGIWDQEYSKYRRCTGCQLKPLCCLGAGNAATGTAVTGDQASLFHVEDGRLVHNPFVETLAAEALSFMLFTQFAAFEGYYIGHSTDSGLNA